MRILTYLVEHAGTAVSRKELQAVVWPSGVFTEFESGLYTAVNQARQALGDSASQPYFIETVPKLGYRFISPVQWDSPAPGEMDQKMRASAAAVMPTGTAPQRGALSRTWPWVVAVLGVLITSGGLLLNRVRAAPPALDHLRPFTASPGTMDHASFSPDGEMVAFEGTTPASTHASIYVQRLDAPTAVRLSKGQEEEWRPVWSPGGRQVAFLRDVDATTFAIVSEPLNGTTGERKWAKFQKDPRLGNMSFDWSRDGRWFAVAESTQPGGPLSIVSISATTGERRTITNPPAGWRGDSGSVFSPDSSHILFRRTMAESSVEDIYEAPLAGGRAKRLTFDNRMIKSYAFTPDEGLLFSSKRTSSISMLWWLSPGRDRLYPLTAPAFNATSPAVSRDGKHIAFTKLLFDVNIWRVNADGSGAAKPLINSELPDLGGSYSPDGQRIAFASERSGRNEIWVSDAQGANAVRLFDGRGAQVGNPKWSPDGRWIVFEWQPSGRSEIYVVGSNGGTPRKVVADEYQNSVPSWSHDGRFLYFASSHSSQHEIWKIPAEGGAAVQLTKANAFAPLESPDGRYLYYFSFGENGEVRRLPLRDGIPIGAESRIVSGLKPRDWGNWAPGNGGIYYIPQSSGGRPVIQYLDFASGIVRNVHVLQNSPVYGNSGLALSPDGKVILFAEIDQDSSNIFLQ